jgi:2-desacetyl-2-hydroxyethyl bacteriochlorophyllide A dehydrogenase
MNRQSLYFVQPRQVAIADEIISGPGSGQLLIRSLVSAISPGTELLIYRGQVPETMALDETLADLNGKFTFPFKYGYAVVGQVIEIGPDVPPHWQGQRVFAFHPHESHFITTPAAVLPLPANLSPQDAVFLPNMETAVNLVLDGAPRLGERVLVFGQGIIGLFTTALLAQFPLGHLVTVDQHALRREISLGLGAHISLEPAELPLVETLFRQEPSYQGADLIFELSGNPLALDQAVSQAGFDGRIIVGSWYGAKSVSLDLGSRFHRQRIRLISSQVSTIAPELTGRWTKARRMQVAWHMLQKIRPARFITHQFHLTEAPRAYQLLDQTPEQTIQTILTYNERTD